MPVLAAAAMSGAAFILAHLAFAAALAVIMAALGRRLAALAAPALRRERWGLPLALGLGASGCALALLAVMGRLTLPWMAVLLAGAAAAAAPEWRPLLADLASLARRPRLLWALAALAAAAPPLALALYPPTGFDALLYHLPAAARLAAGGRIAVAPELRFPAFPWLNELLFAAAMRLADDVAAQLVECTAFLGVAALLWEMARRRWGAWAGALAAALWLGSPLAAWAAASAYVEPLEALFLLAAVEALLLAQETRDARAAIVAGALAGCAAAVKYQGLFAVALVAVALVRWDSPAPAAETEAGAPRRRRRRPATFPLAGALVAAAAVALPWYVWIGAATGDPVFPLLTRLGHAPAAGVPGLPPWHGWGMASWTAWRQAVWPYPPGSPLLWLLAPLPVLARRGFPQAGWLGMTGLSLVLITASVRPDPRMLSVAAPLFAAAIAAVVVPWSLARRGPAGAAPRLLALVLLALLPGWCYTALLAARRGAVPHDPVQRESYLRRQLPGYAALSWLNASHGAHYAVYGLWAENLRYLAAGRFLGDWYGPAPFAAALRAAGRPAALRDFLVSAGADHLLVRRVPGQPDPVGCGDPRFAGFLRAEHCDGEASVWVVEAAAPWRGGS